MNEQSIQKAIITKLETRGCYVVKIVHASKAGIPDILGCYRGRFFSIEVKTPTTINTVSKLQQYNLGLVIKAGGYSTVMWNVEQVDKFLQEIDNGIV